MLEKRMTQKTPCPPLSKMSAFVAQKDNSSCDRTCNETSTLKFCRVCGFRVRVWESYRTSRSFGYGCESVTELPEVLGIVARAYRTHRSSGLLRNVLYPYPGCCGTRFTELTEVPGTGMNILQN